MSSFKLFLVAWQYDEKKMTRLFDWQQKGCTSGYARKFAAYKKGKENFFGSLKI